MKTLSYSPAPDHSHPSWCSPELCSSSPSNTDLAHREVREPFIPAGDHHNVLTLARVQLDDLRDVEGQVVFPPELEVGLGGETTHLTGREALTLAQRLTEIGHAILAVEGGAL